MPFYLYGHYDSRGGASLYEADNKEQADEAYAAAFQNTDIEEFEYGGQKYAAVTKAELDKNLLEEDFICEVKFTANHPYEYGEDLEQHEWPEEAMKWEDEQGFGFAVFEFTAEKEEKRDTTPNPFAPLLWIRGVYGEMGDRFTEFDDGYKGPAEMSYEPPGVKPEGPGWRRSSLGEDAFGLLVLNAKVEIDRMK